MNFVKIKNFHPLKDAFKRVKNQTIDWEKIFTIHICEKGLASEYINNSYNSMIRTQTPNENMGKRFEQTFL